MGAVRGKTQTFNPSTGQYVKRDADAGRFEAAQKDGTPFKGVRVEKVTVKLNPNIPKETLAKAKKAVQAVMRHGVVAPSNPVAKALFPDAKIFAKFCLNSLKLMVKTRLI